MQFTKTDGGDFFNPLHPPHPLTIKIFTVAQVVVGLLLSAAPHDTEELTMFAIIILFIITRPWPAFGRQGLDGSSGRYNFK